MRLAKQDWDLSLMKGENENNKIVIIHLLIYLRLVFIDSSY